MAKGPDRARQTRLVPAARSLLPQFHMTDRQLKDEARRCIALRAGSCSRHSDGSGGVSVALRIALFAGIILALLYFRQPSFLVDAEGRLSPNLSVAADAAEGSPRATFVGRVWPGPVIDGTAALPQLLSWSASSATFAFRGASSVTVVLNGSLGDLPKSHAIQSQAFPSFPESVFQMDLDGRPVGTATVNLSDPVLAWSLGISTGRHTLTITKLSEARDGAAWLHSVRLAGRGAAFLPPPRSPGQQSGRRILVIGDSYSAGLGNTGWPRCRRVNKANVTNALLAYGPLVASHFKADAHLVAWSGAGMSVRTRMFLTELPKAVRVASGPTMSDLLLRADALNPEPLYDASSWVPQIVVLAAGTNDIQDVNVTRSHHIKPGPFMPPTMQLWTDSYLALIQQIRRLYPEAAIINIAWPLEVQLVGVKPLPAGAVYLQYMAAAFSRLQRAGVTNTFFLQLNGAEMRGTRFCTMHPDAAGHAYVASQLIEFIDGVAPWFGATPVRGKRQQ